MIPAGTVLTFDVQGTTGQFWVRTDEGVRADAISSLMAFSTVESLGLERPGLFDDPWTFATGLHWPYTATVRLATKYDHASIDDVVSIVLSAFNSATGEFPTVTARGYQASQDPAIVTTGPGALTVLGVSGIGLGIVAVLAAGVAVLVWRKT